MSITKILFGIFSAGLSLIAENIIFGKITKTKISISKIKYIFLFILFATLIYLNNVYNINESTFIIQLILMILFNKLTYKEDSIRTIIKTGAIFILIAIFEVLLTIFLIIGKYKNLEVINDDYLFKLIFSALDLLLVYGSINIKRNNKFLNKIVELIAKNAEKYLLSILVIILFFGGIISYKITFTYTDKNLYFSNICLIILFGIITALLLNEFLNRMKEKEKQNALMDSMSKYEEFIDAQRISRHELLNNLITLKSFKNKNTKDFEAALNELIYQNEQNELSGLNSLYNLPSGIKGMLYYKIHDMRSKGLDVFVNVDRSAICLFDKLDSKKYVEICRMIGIFLDNARDAAYESKNKQVIIDVFKEKEELVIYIENTFKGKININKINEKNYTSKGNGHGIGLYVVNSIISKSDSYKLIQEINIDNNFVTKLKIKK